MLRGCYDLKPHLKHFPRAESRLFSACHETERLAMMLLTVMVLTSKLAVESTLQRVS